MSCVKEEVLQSQEINELRSKSILLDSIKSERDDLLCRLESMGEVEGQLKEAKALLNQSQLMESELTRLKLENSELRTLKCKYECQNENLRLLKDEKDEINAYLECVRLERDEMREKLHEITTYVQDFNTLQCERKCMQAELDALRNRAQEAEVLKLERDRMNLRIEELEVIEMEVLQLVSFRMNIHKAIDVEYVMVVELLFETLFFKHMGESLVKHLRIRI